MASSTHSNNPRKDVPWFNSPPAQHLQPEISDSSSSLPPPPLHNPNNQSKRDSPTLDPTFITENSSQYTSVLKLSAVVSALPTFSSALNMSKPAPYSLNSSASFISRSYNRGSAAKIAPSVDKRGPPPSLAKDHDNGDDGVTYVSNSSNSSSMNPPNIATSRDGDHHEYALNTQFSKEKEEEKGVGVPIAPKNGPTIPRGWLKEKARDKKRLGGEEEEDFDGVIEVKPPISNVIIVRRPKACPSKNHGHNNIDDDDDDNDNDNDNDGDGVGDHPKRIKLEYPHDHNDTISARSNVRRPKPSPNAGEEGLSTREAHILSVLPGPLGKHLR